MPEKLSEGDTITLQGEVTLVHDDGTDDGTPARLRLDNRRASEPGGKGRTRRKPLYDRPDLATRPRHRSDGSRCGTCRTDLFSSIPRQHPKCDDVVIDVVPHSPARRALDTASRASLEFPSTCSVQAVGSRCRRLLVM